MIAPINEVHQKDVLKIKPPGPIGQLDTSIELPWNCNSTLRSAPRGRPRCFLDPEHLGTTGTGTSTATSVGGLFDVTPHLKQLKFIDESIEL